MVSVQQAFFRTLSGAINSLRYTSERTGRAMHEDEPPPFLGSWPRVYTAVLIYLAILILLLYAVTRFLTY
jgi:hypothetical protein